MYTRASASDYDDFQAEGWKTEQLIPLMKKHETYQRASQNRCDCIILLDAVAADTLL